MVPCPGLYPTREPQLGSPTLLRSSQAIGALVVALALLLSAALNAGAAPLAPHSPALLVESNPVYYDVPLTPVVEQEADYRIAITELGFEPAVLAVPPAAVVEWVNADVQGHSATYLPDGGQAASRQATGWDSGVCLPGRAIRCSLAPAAVSPMATGSTARTAASSWWKPRRASRSTCRRCRSKPVSGPTPAGRICRTDHRW